MARIRDTYIEDDLALSDSGVKIVPINIVDPIAELIIRFKAKNYAENEDNYIHDVVSKVELVDGSDVLMSMDLKQMQAIHYYNKQKMPSMGIFEWLRVTQSARQNLIFGRDLMDFDYAFDPTRFRNPQLRVTWDLAEIRAVDGTGFASESAKLQVIARCIEQAPRRPTAFLMTKEIYDWLTAAAGDEPVVLPTDYPYRMLMVRCYQAGIDPCTNITDLKLSCDQDAYVPFQYHTGDLGGIMLGWFVEPQTHGRWMLNGGAWKDVFIGRPLKAFVGGEPAGGFFAVEDMYGGKVKYGGREHDGTVIVGTHGGTWGAWGQGYHNTWCVPFGDPGQPEEWFKAPDYKSIRLLATQGVKDAAASVVLQQVRPY